jgi:hypothetical protein
MSKVLAMDIDPGQTIEVSDPVTDDRVFVYVTDVVPVGNVVTVGGFVNREHCPSPWGDDDSWVQVVDLDVVEVVRLIGGGWS